MSGRKFQAGGRVVVSQNPVDASDKPYIGKVGTVEAYTHHNDEKEVYRVLLDEADYPISLYDVDLFPFNELEVLRSELTQAEAEVVRLKESIKVKERDGAELPIGTVITYIPSYGPVSLTKQSEDVWLCVPSDQRVELWNNYNVTQLLTADPEAVVHKP